MPIESFAPHRHLKLVEGVLHHVIRIKLIDLVHNNVHTASQRIGKEEEFRPGQGLEARQAKLFRLEEF